MPIITLPKLQLVKAVAGPPVSVSNFSKAVVSCHLSAADNAFNGGKCTISLFEAIRNNNAIDAVRIGSKVVNIVDATNQDISVDFPKNNVDFPGPSVFAHSYFAVLQIRKAQGRAAEFATTPARLLEAAALVPVP